MLCPEVWNFPPPKIITSYKKCQDFEAVSKVVERNNFYKSVIITCPDEIHTPQFIEEALLEDTDFYKVFNCPITEFVDRCFIENFVKSGKLYCLSADTNCMTQSCAALTLDGVLSIHVQENIYQILGLEGTKCPYNYYQLKIHLKDLKNTDRIRNALNELRPFNFYLSWEPGLDNVCPSSIAKYFCDKNYKVTCHSLVTQKIIPCVKMIPTLVGSEIEEIVEWVGMLAHNADLSPTESYISSYSIPESSSFIESSRISVLIVKGFITPNIILNTCKLLSEHVVSRELNDYWASLSVQSMENSLWQWNTGSPRTFQSQNASCNLFFTQKKHSIFYLGQLKYT